MKNEDEIKFWKKAVSIIEKGYGGRHCHKPIDMDMRCIQCWSGFVVSWIHGHIDLIRWSEKQDKEPKG